ncbi:type II toxin-antitoxin system RelE/ParE family toxin [Rossellomorea vietnamensis]|uniref:Type II toxin-antitoxin system RelE/ParE family toxin n=1 Tax=Rossellomorea vietnamensis TaxID=218284 RepID=A0A5D4NTS2_9BACI|nr:type II toxin-antitoxin system RelE/ParE family toxin [Rossellomorea vietnamensis]
MRAIYEYIAFTLLEPEVAARQLERFENAIMSLDELPFIFHSFEAEPWHSRGLCQMPMDNFSYFYIPREKEKTVTIIRVMYGERNIDEQLNKTDY